ncbi:hypothetical protein BTO06_10260 [Tenacibaculum sp. SZ-18]|uniref:TlpA family protein disulfide reductase n=1 Tax=Tenacibaculum sp. SZ-18 TaxID=754423 RepID=UPI000C2D5C16|nr:TlpA disulfide reductase family protein [Tenacibaculum sp. SZ-18]AUC15499.1 hypothetical protein BTO06_10260 [Tenacibaculum sp. SZ-18]
MTYKFLKLSVIIILLSNLILSCEDKKENTFSVLQVSIKNHKQLDSLIIYDKENSWEIKSTIRFKQSNSVTDTLNISETKRYEIYSFIDGKQGSLGELFISSNSNIILSIDENQLFESVNYSGSFETPNNFLAFSKNYQNELTQIVRNGIEEDKLENMIKEKSNLINEKGKALKIVDSLSSYVDQKFNDFSEILKQKNIKYLYKASLIGKIGNDFKFKDLKNNVKSLKDFKGKYVYIDVWATWCKPCKVEYPFLRKLEQYFSKSNEIKIISVSTDEKFEKWKKYIDENSIEGTQLYSGANSDFVKFYDIGALPRFIFLDKEGKVINPEEIRPSNPGLLEKLEANLH